MKNLYILPFDHRSSFTKDILNTEKPSKEQRKEIERLKDIIFEGIEISLEKRKDKKNFAILVDEEYGSNVIKNARAKKIKICLPVEKSGENELKFEYGKKFKEHILKINPDFVKVLVRYNPENKTINQRQLKSLAELSIFCKEKKLQTIIELLVPPTKNDLDICGNKNDYDKKLRAEKTAQSIKEIKTVFNPTIWKLEGFDKNNWKTIVKETKKTKIIVLGRGEDDKKVKQWLRDAAKFNQIIGFAVGRTIFMSPIKEYYSKKINAQKASLLISKKFLSFVSIWEKQKNYENL
jgi:5-dehydro-2-deoxygluconokinase